MKTPIALAALLALAACGTAFDPTKNAKAEWAETGKPPSSPLAPGLTVKSKGYEVMLGALAPSPEYSNERVFEAPYFVRAAPKDASSILTCTILTAKGELLAGIAVPVKLREGGMLRARVTHRQPAHYDCAID